MTNPTAPATPESPRLARLSDEVKAHGQAALDRFWRELARTGTPLVEPVPGFPGVRLVTVVWREDRPVEGVYLLANRVTDKHRVRHGMMRRLDGTDVWYVGLRLPLGLRSTYRIHPFGADDPHMTSDGPRSGTFRELPDDRVDPLNRHAGGPFGSLIELDGAPSLAQWPTTAGPHPGEALGFTTADGSVYRVRRFVPDTCEAGPAPGLLVVCDGERWFDRYGITAAITGAVEAGRIPPMAVVGIEAGADVAARMRQLGADPRFIDALADELLPAVTKDLPRPPGPRNTVLCGQSLGGLTALAAALRRPDAFGTVLAHSASTWWRPGMTARPARPAGGAETWLYEQAAAAPVGDVRIRMDVGSNEGPMVDDLHRLHALMAARGFDVSLNVYTGGHDYSCWAAALIEGLSEQLVPHGTGPWGTRSG
ncbi:alpha/beta hydrolase-fold protein [Streptomyces sp. NBC_00006]|uniref:alpha/beta hydrolase-fold protein n=1 Tax=Streptomyces sp. NBC_00006 TaxID=2975619 RepID=UPI0022564EE7|nr:alpha/beta hydrolase-fold protein [Streptomyces sp. NBC_00006]MCX5534965.1 alpha/beta hydrolase-fold protein [Streptomyces sp. NBC_00006]